MSRHRPSGQPPKFGLYIGPWQELQLAKFRDEAMKQFQAAWEDTLAQRLDHDEAHDLNAAVAPLINALPIDKVVSLRDLKIRRKIPSDCQSTSSVVSAPAVVARTRVPKVVSITSETSTIRTVMVPNRHRPSSSVSISSNGTDTMSTQSAPVSGSRNVKTKKPPVKHQTIMRRRNSAINDSDAVHATKIVNSTDTKKVSAMMRVVRRNTKAKKKKPPRPINVVPKQVRHVKKMKKLYQAGVRAANAAKAEDTENLGALNSTTATTAGGAAGGTECMRVQVKVQAPLSPTARQLHTVTSRFASGTITEEERRTQKQKIVAEAGGIEQQQCPIEDEENDEFDEEMSIGSLDDGEVDDLINWTEGLELDLESL